MRKLFSLFLTLLATATLSAQRFQAGDLYYQVCTGEEDVLVDRYDTIGWNIPAEAITVAQAREICAALESGETTGTKYYVMGYIKAMHSKHVDGITTYGNAQFYMEDVKGANSQEIFLAFQVYGPNGKKITDPAAVAVGDFVVIYGELTNYNGTYETVGKGSAYIWKSTNPLLEEPSEKPTEPEVLVIPEEAKSWNIPAEAIDVIKAREICAALAAGDSTEEKYYVMGYVKKLHVNYTQGIMEYGNAQFYMVNVKGNISPNDFLAFQVYGPNGAKIQDPAAVQEGDFVIVYGKLKNFMGNTYETVGKGSAYIWKSTNPLLSDSSHPQETKKTTSHNIMAFDTAVDQKDAAINPNNVYVTYQTIGAANYNTLRSVDIPKTVEYEGVTYNVIGIGFAAFKHSTLESITIPSSIKIVGEHVFDNCSALTNVVWNVKHHADFNYKTVGSTYDCTSPFYNIRSQITSFVFGNEVEYIPAYLCCEMNNLNKITIPTNVKEIGNYALSGTGHYNDDSNWENDVLYIDNCLIRAKKTLSGDYAIKDGTRLIAASALFLRQELISVTIPNSVTNIGAYAFDGCSGLNSITCEATTPPTVGNYAFNSLNNQIPVFVPCGAVSAYRATTGWNEFPNITEPYAQYSIAVNSQDGEMGVAEVEKNTLCGAIISATAHLGYHFTKWSDGNSDNPRILELTQDTMLTAEFAISHSGRCGDNLYWSYDKSDQSISIIGSGDMYDYTSETQPWLLFKEQIKMVATSSTTTSIGESAFAGAIRLGDVYLGSDIETIAENAFAKCNRLYHIYCYPTYPPFAKQSSFANYNVYLHVPCDYKEDYDLDVVFGNFKYIECLGAETDNTPTDSVIVNASSTSVIITWPTDENADTYTIVIKQGDVIFCTLTFNADGQLLNIAFAPAKNGSDRSAQYATQTTNGLRFTVTGLNESTHYTYDITAKSNEGDTLQTHTGAFTTKSNASTEVDNINAQTSATQKLFRDNQLLILRAGKTYNAMGQEM
jgi:hypothetical protein